MKKLEGQIGRVAVVLRERAQIEPAGELPRSCALSAFWPTGDGVQPEATFSGSIRATFYPSGTFDD
jgi:hypothetical protein